MGVFAGPEITESGLVLALDGANKKSFYGYWSGSYGTAANAFDGNLSTFSGGAGGTFSATYTFNNGLDVSGTVRVYVTFGASSGQVNGRTGVILVDGNDISSKMAAANVYASSPGWVDVTSEVGSIFNTVVLNGTSGSTNPSIAAIEVNGQILVGTTWAGTTWADLSGNGNFGTTANSPTYSTANGGSLSFDGSDDFIAIPSQFDAQSPLTGYGSFTGADTNAFSLEIWIKTTQISGTNAFTAPHLIGRDDGDIYSNLTLYNGYVYFVHYNSAWLDNLKSTTMVSNGLWHQVVYVNNTNETGTIYIDGISEVSGSSSLSGTNYFSPDYIGRGYSGQYYQGNIANCKFYDKSLSAAEVSQNYNALRGRFGI